MADPFFQDDDPRWYQFGLNAPADPETPGIPEAPTPTPGAPASGMLFLDWPDARRAERYRVWRKLPTDADFLAVETTTESESTLEDQPLGLAIAYRITAANDAGESLPSPEISVTLN